MTPTYTAAAARRGQRVPRLLAVCALLATSWLDIHQATADRYEATVAVRPMGGVGHVTEDVAGAAGGASVSTYGGGGEVTVGYGVRNWLDVGGELAVVAFTRATYDAAMVTIMGIPTTGRVTRTMRLTQLRAGATLRLGVAWVPTIYLGAGLSARMPTAGTLRVDNHGDALDLTPDGMAAGVQLDACVVARIGFEHRIDRRWSVGVAMDASRTLGLGAPPVDMVSGGVSLSYTWYPLW
jgi:hypothetical protein